MTIFEKNGIEVYMPDDDEKSRQNMIVAAEFMARMIQKHHAYEEMNIAVVSPEELKVSSERLLDWIRNNGIRYLAIHWDLDVLDPLDFRSITTAAPYTSRDDYDFAVGNLKLEEAVRVISDVSDECELVGLTIAEHFPWDAIRLRKELKRLRIFQ